jgi:hypothetical protein
VVAVGVDAPQWQMPQAGRLCVRAPAARHYKSATEFYRDEVVRPHLGDRDDSRDPGTSFLCPRIDALVSRVGDCRGLTVLRDGSQLEIAVRLGARPSGQ